VVDDLQSPEPLPAYPEVQVAAAGKILNCELPMSVLQEAKQEVGAAGPVSASLKLDYFYALTPVTSP